MTGQWLTLFFLSSGTAVVLLFSVVLFQQQKLRRLERDYEASSRSTGRSKPASLGGERELLSESPFPVCYVDHKGLIKQASKSFEKLAPGAKSLPEFDQQTGTGLARLKPGKHQMRVSLRTADDLRTFSLVAWPIKGKYEILGNVFVLLEHTALLRHVRTRYEFEEELLALQGELAKAVFTSKEVSPAVQTLAQELVDLSEFLQAAHKTHQPQESASFDIAELAQDVIAEYRPLLRKQQIAITSTLPHSLFARGIPAATRASMVALFGTAAEHAHPHSTVRFHLGLENNEVVWHMTLPAFPISDNALRSAFTFGRGKQGRAGRAQLATARLLLSHQQGSLSFTVDENGVAVAVATLPKGRVA